MSLELASLKLCHHQLTTMMRHFTESRRGLSPLRRSQRSGSAAGHEHTQTHFEQVYALQHTPLCEHACMCLHAFIALIGLQYPFKDRNESMRARNTCSEEVPFSESFTSFSPTYSLNAVNKCLSWQNCNQSHIYWKHRFGENKHLTASGGKLHLSCTYL